VQREYALSLYATGGPAAAAAVAVTVGIGRGEDPPSELSVIAPHGTPTPMPCARPPHGDEQCPCEEQRRAMSRGWLGGAWRYAIEARAAYLTVSP
jgi:poly(3-hydroxybutyrate) depolymerase